MKILIVGLGGVTRSFRHWPERVLALALARRGHTVWAIGTRDRSREALAQPHELIEGVEVFRVRSGYWPNRELAQALASGPRPDIIHLLHPRNVLAAQTTAWARRQGIPTVYTWLGPYHDHYLTPDRERPLSVAATPERLIFSRQDLLRRLAVEKRPRDVLRNYRLHWPLRAATALAPCSEFEAEVLRLLGMTQPQQVVPLWVDVPFIESTPVELPALDLPRPWLLFVGQITPRKGYDLAVRALPGILESYPSASLLVVSGLNQAQRQQLTAMAAEANVGQHVHMLGYQPDAALINLYRASDVLLFPTRYEGFGLPLLEAMAAECAIVTSDIPVVREIVQHGENGLLVEPNNPQALAQAALRLLDDQGLHDRLVDGGRQTLRERYQEQRLVAQLEGLYKATIKRVRQ